jgi:hypothetical protein
LRKPFSTGRWIETGGRDKCRRVHGLDAESGLHIFRTDCCIVSSLPTLPRKAGREPIEWLNAAPGGGGKRATGFRTGQSPSHRRLGTGGRRARRWGVSTLFERHISGKIVTERKWSSQSVSPQAPSQVPLAFCRHTQSVIPAGPGSADRRIAGGKGRLMPIQGAEAVRGEEGRPASREKDVKAPKRAAHYWDLARSLIQTSLRTAHRYVCGATR